jgi:hypothetical protein
MKNSLVAGLLRHISAITHRLQKLNFWKEAFSLRSFITCLCSGGRSSYFELHRELVKETEFRRKREFKLVQEFQLRESSR